MVLAGRSAAPAIAGQWTAAAQTLGRNRPATELAPDRNVRAVDRGDSDPRLVRRLRGESFLRGLFAGANVLGAGLDDPQPNCRLLADVRSSAADRAAHCTQSHSVAG